MQTQLSNAFHHDDLLAEVNTTIIRSLSKTHHMLIQSQLPYDIRHDGLYTDANTNIIR